MKTNKQTQKELFLKYLIDLNLDGIDSILDDSKSYFGVEKKLVMSKLEEIFYFIKYYNKDAKPSITESRLQKGKYFLKIKDAGNTVKFCILEDKHGNILNLYSPNKLESEDDYELISWNTFDFYDDQKVDFLPSNEYLELHDKCSKIYSHFDRNEKVIFTNDKVKSFINKYCPLYSDINKSNKYSYFHRFSILYYNCIEINVLLSKYHEISEFVNDFKANAYDKLLEIYHKEYLFNPWILRTKLTPSKGT